MALNINGTTGISGVDGSVSAPAVTGTDSNTGITFPAADTIKFATGDNSSYSTVSITYYSIPAIGLYNYGWGGTDFMMDVTDTSTDKVKLGNYSADYVTWETQTNYNLNIATFLRLGDT